MAPRPKPLVRYLSLEGDVIAKVNKVLGAAVRDLDRDIARLQGSSKIGDQITLLQARQTRLALKRQTATVFTNIEDVMARGKRSAASLASKMVSDEENPLLKLVMSGKAMRELAEDEALRAASTVETVMARFSSSYKPLSQRVYNSDQLTKGLVDNMVNTQLAKGASWGDFSKAARNMIDPNTPGGVAYAAKRLARTEINNAFHASSAERYRNSNVPGLMVVWNLSGSHKVPDDCNKYDEEGPYAPEAVPEKPHPQCLCFLTAELPDEDEFLDLLFGSKGPTIDEDLSAPATAIPYAPDFDVEDGMRKAESMRKLLEMVVYDNKGNYNKAKGWTADSRRAWTGYTEMGHKNMNLMLRDPAKFAAEFAHDPSYVEYYAEQIKLVADILLKNETSKDIVVARGVLVDAGFNPRDFVVGDLFADPAFLSTTSNIKEALDFAAGRGRVNDVEGWVFMIKVPKGTPAIPGADYQSEMLFKPGQIQNIIGIDVEKKIIYTEMTP